VHPKGADSIAVSGLFFENALVGSECSLLCTNGLRKQCYGADSMDVSGLFFETPWLALSGPLLSSYAQKLRFPDKQSSRPARHPFPTGKHLSQSGQAVAG